MRNDKATVGDQAQGPNDVQPFRVKHDRPFGLIWRRLVAWSILPGQRSNRVMLREIAHPSTEESEEPGCHIHRPVAVAK